MADLVALVIDVELVGAGRFHHLRVVERPFVPGSLGSHRHKGGLIGNVPPVVAVTRADQLKIHPSALLPLVAVGSHGSPAFPALGAQVLGMVGVGNSHQDALLIAGLDPVPASIVLFGLLQVGQIRVLPMGQIPADSRELQGLQALPLLFDDRQLVDLAEIDGKVGNRSVHSHDRFHPAVAPGAPTVVAAHVGHLVTGPPQAVGGAHQYLFEGTSVPPVFQFVRGADSALARTGQRVEEYEEKPLPSHDVVTGGAAIFFQTQFRLFPVQAVAAEGIAHAGLGIRAVHGAIPGAKQPQPMVVDEPQLLKGTPLPFPSRLQQRIALVSFRLVDDSTDAPHARDQIVVQEEFLSVSDQNGRIRLEGPGNLGETQLVDQTVEETGQGIGTRSAHAEDRPVTARLRDALGSGRLHPLHATLGASVEIDPEDARVADHRDVRPLADGDRAVAEHLEAMQSRAAGIAQPPVGGQVHLPGGLRNPGGGVHP